MSQRGDMVEFSRGIKTWTLKIGPAKQVHNYYPGLALNYNVKKVDPVSMHVHSQAFDGLKRKANLAKIHTYMHTHVDNRI